MKKVEEAIEYFEGLLERLGNGDCDNMVCATALDALYEKRERDTLLSEVSGGVEVLTKRQLLSASVCNGCKKCGIYAIGDERESCTIKIAKTALAYRGMLERLEWASVSLASLPALKSTCPICCCLKDEGHASDCEYAALLK